MTYMLTVIPEIDHRCLEWPVTINSMDQKVSNMMLNAHAT